jgi:hypothetical protein
MDDITIRDLLLFVSIGLSAYGLDVLKTADKWEGLMLVGIGIIVFITRVVLKKHGYLQGVYPQSNDIDKDSTAGL